jgi:hypothetical protein
MRAILRGNIVANTKSPLTELQLSKRLAEILVYGHLALFIYAFVVWAFGRFEGEDTAQVILMGSPLLATVSASAYQLIIKGSGGKSDDTPLADPTQIRGTVIPVATFLVLLFMAYSTALVQTPIHVDFIKIGVGAIETGLGFYLAAARDRFFPPKAA